MTIRMARFPSALPVRYQRGFTLVELIVVIIVIGILGAVAASRLTDRGGFDSRAFADQAASLVRYGQKVAIAQNRNVYVRINSSGVALCFQASCAAGTRVPGPAGGNSNSSATIAACADTAWACEAPPAGVTLSANTQFYFDALGKPFALADVAPTAVSTFATLAVATTAGGVTRSFTVEAETGYVH